MFYFILIFTYLPKQAKERIVQLELAQLQNPQALQGLSLNRTSLHTVFEKEKTYIWNDYFSTLSPPGQHGTTITFSKWWSGKKGNLYQWKKFGGLGSLKVGFCRVELYSNCDCHAHSILRWTLSSDDLLFTEWNYSCMACSRKGKHHCCEAAHGQRSRYHYSR